MGTTTDATRRAEGVGGGSGGGDRGVPIAPTLATTFMGCRQSAAWELSRKSGGRWTTHPKIDEPGGDGAAAKGMADLTSEKGIAHEGAILKRLQTQHGDGVAVIKGDGERKGNFEAQLAVRLAETRAAMDLGVPIVHQAALLWERDGHRWFGYADFLRRVPVPCESWPDGPDGPGWSYEPWDAKLATRPKPSHLLQLCLYDAMLAHHQGQRLRRAGDPSPRIGILLGEGVDRETGGPLTDADFGAPDPWGDGAALVAVKGCRPASFPLDAFRHYANRVAGRVATFVSGMPQEGIEPEPCAHCGVCRYEDHCGVAWREADHLSLTAGISRSQRQKLVKAGVKTQTALAALAPDDCVTGWADEWKAANDVSIGTDTLERLAHQALMQKRTRALREDDPDAAPAVDPLPLADDTVRGLARLPKPDEGDVWFDFEGDPLHPGGLDYLNGVMVRASALRDDTRESFCAVEHDPSLAFRAFWAHDRAQEGEAFHGFVTWWGRHLAHHPGAHLYHYAPYEKTALRRMGSLHPVSAEHADDVPGGAHLVDLYPVVREALRAGTPSYSIKDIEKLYRFERTADTKSGGDSVVMWHAFRDGAAVGEREGTALLDDIEAYNEEDCVSTVELHRYLLEHAERGGVEPGAALTAWREREEARKAGRDEQRTERQRAASTKRAEERAKRRDDAHALHASLAPSPGANDTRVRTLARDLALFHEREDRPGRWEYMDRLYKATAELTKDFESLGGLTADPECWGVPEKQSKLYRFRVPPQDTKLTEDSDVALGGVDEDWLGVGAGTIHEWDEDQGLLTLKRGTRSSMPQEPPETISLVPSTLIDKGNIIDRTLEVCRDAAGSGDRFPHLAKFLRRVPPSGDPDDRTPVIPDGTTDPDAVLDAIKAAALGLDRSWLAIQGPPGTGKTHTIARVIEALVDAGQAVGVTANSHKVINNVLEKVEACWAGKECKQPTDMRSVLKKKSQEGSNAYTSRHGYGGETKDTDQMAGANVYGGTAWTFTDPKFPLHPDCPADDEVSYVVDTLIIDEAGQFSLGMMVAAAARARNVILVGDPQQLAQPLQGSHPGESGMSCLEYVLGENPVVPPHLGAFLATTWRMHPNLTRWVSDAIYAGRLVPKERAEGSPHHMANQEIQPAKGTHRAIKPHGLSFVELDHEGCSQKSDREADEVVRLVGDLLKAKVRDATGQVRAMGRDENGRGNEDKKGRKSVLVVAPYNVQVNHLRRRLDEAGFGDVPVGTVDKFQGQEAEAVIVSMTTSDAEHMPRDASFLFSQNRLNVAVSRARCLAIVVAARGLLEFDATTVAEMRLANLLCWLASEGTVR